MRYDGVLCPPYGKAPGRVQSVREDREIIHIYPLIMQTYGYEDPTDLKRTAFSEEKNSSIVY
jgi:hypothetical protein